MKVYDIDGVEFDKDPVDVAECVKSLGWTTEPKPEKPEKPTRQKPAKIKFNND